MSAYGLRPHFEGEYIHASVPQFAIDILIVTQYPLPGCAAMRRLSSVNRLGLSSYEGGAHRYVAERQGEGEGKGRL